MTRIEVLEEPTYIALRRNEVKDVASVDAVARWMNGEDDPEPIWADGDRDLLGSDEKGRTQRQTMALREVRYRLHGQILPWPGFGGQRTALDEQFRRRAEHGKCFHQPYLGMREFPAFFKLAEDAAASAPIQRTEDLGLMVYDVFDLSRPGGPHDRPFVSLFRAHLDHGTIVVPDYDDPTVLKPERSVA